MITRRATPQDALTIAKARRNIWETVYRGIYPDEMLDEYDVEVHAARDRRNLQNPDLQFYVIFDEETCIGYYSYGPCAFGSYRDFKVCLNSLYLLPAYRRHGFGTRVFQEVRQFCRNRNISKFFCACQPENMPAVAFYEAMGGQVGAVDTGHEDAAENTIIFEFTVEEEI